jgi:radical SAM protein with 4Fe4S-binding SPASM domain
MKNWNIGWGLTSACNSKCKHCYNDSGFSSFDKITFEQAKNIVNKLCKKNVQTINYGTGESGLVSYFWDLVKYAFEKGIVQGLTTNGSSVSNSTIDNIKKYINDIDVSLDYLAELENNEFRCSDHAWEWAISAINILRENNINFSIVTCLHSQNSNFETIDKFLSFCKKYGCEWRINWFKPTGRGKLDETLKLDPIKVHDIFRHIASKSIITALPDPYFSAILGLNTRIGSPCGIESFRITPSTEVVPCVYFTKEMKSISILENSFDDVVNSDVMVCSKNRNPDFCCDCEFYVNCKGGCTSRAYLEYYDINSPDAFCFKKNGLKTNPLENCKFIYEPQKNKVHENYLCTFIVKPL